MQGIIRANHWLTRTGVILIVDSGSAAVMAGGLKPLSVGMFSLSGLVFGLAPAPQQRHIVAILASTTDLQTLQAPLGRWHIFGWFALLSPWPAVAMMVLEQPG
jgi:hypothetical protein